MGTVSTRLSPVNVGDLLNAALDYAARSWSIIPTLGKKSVGLWKPFQTRPAAEKTLRRLFAKRGVTGLAVITGKVSCGLAVRDFDQAGAYQAWAAQNPAEAASLPTVATARGAHVYGRLDKEAFADLGDGELRATLGITSYCRPLNILTARRTPGSFLFPHPVNHCPRCRAHSRRDNPGRLKTTQDNSLHVSRAQP